MGCGMSMVKYILFLFNLLCAICGLALCYYGGKELYSYAQMGGSGSLALSIVILVLGIIIFNISWYGCCGAIRESYCMVMTYSIFIFILLIIQIIIIIYAYASTPQDFATEGIKLIEKEWVKTEINKKPTDIIIGIQKGYECCGKESINDYQYQSLFAIPASCCPTNVASCNTRTAYQRGCRQAYVQFYVKNWDALKYGAIALAVVELIAFIFGFYLANSIRNHRRRFSY